MSVVYTNLRFHIERTLLERIKLRILWRPIVTPRVRSAARSLRLP